MLLSALICSRLQKPNLIEQALGRCPGELALCFWNRGCGLPHRHRGPSPVLKLGKHLISQDTVKSNRTYSVRPWNKAQENEVLCCVALLQAEKGLLFMVHNR